MNILQVILRLASAAISLYTLLCFIRILLTWIPNMGYNKFTLFLGKICDPYLNLFRRIRWLKFGALDFSPVLALALLAVFSTAMTELSIAGTTLALITLGSTLDFSKIKGNFKVLAFCSAFG